jgi:hypothetical protein
MAMSLLATHLKLNRDGETFFIGGKMPQLNKESLIAHRAKRIAAASASLSKVLPDRGNHCAQRIEKCAAVNTVIEINIRRISDPERDNRDEENWFVVGPRRRTGQESPHVATNSVVFW